MELKRFDDSAQNDQAKPGLRRIPSIDTQISQETRDALKQIDANICTAMKALIYCAKCGAVRAHFQSQGGDHGE